MNNIKEKTTLSHLTDKTYQTALSLEDRKSWQEAVNAYDKVIKTYPAVAELFFRRGICQIYLKKWTEAELSFSNAISCEGSIAEYYNKLAVALHQQGKTEAVADALKNAIQLDARHASWHFRLAEALISLEDWSSAENALQNAITRNEKVAQYHGTLALVLRKQNRLSKEIEALQAAIALDDSNEQWEARIEKAQEEMEAPAKAQSIYQIALQQIGNAQWEDAEANLLYAISLNKNVPEYHANLATVYRNQADQKKEIDALEQALALDPENDALTAHLDSAKASLEQAFRKKADKFYALGHAALETEMWMDADKAFQKAIKICDEVADFHASLAIAQHEQGLTKDEIKSLEKALELGMASADLYCRLASGYMLENREDDAATALERAIELDPTMPDYYDKYAGILNKTGDRLHESRILEAAVGLQQNYKAFGFRLAEAYIATSRWADAEQALLKTIEVSSATAEHHNVLASVYRALGNRMQEAAVIKQAVALDSGQANWFFRLGEAAEATGNDELAAYGYTNATRLANNNPQWHYRLGYVLHRQKKFALASESYEKAIEIDASPDSTNFGIGTFHEASGYLDLAIDAYREQALSHPDDAVLHARLAGVYERSHKWAEAATAYQRAIELDNTNLEWHCRLDFVVSRAAGAAPASKTAKASTGKKRPPAKTGANATASVPSQTKQYIDGIEADPALKDELRFDAAEHFFSLGLNDFASEMLAAIKNAPAEALLLEAKIDLYANRFDAVEHKALRGMSKLSSKADAETFKDAYYLWIEALQRQEKLLDVQQALQNPPFPTRNNQYFKALRRSIKSPGHLGVYRQCLVHYPRNVGGHDACLFNYSILLRDLGLHDQSHDIARDRLNKNLGRLGFGSKKVVRSESWVSDAEIALHDLKQALDKQGIEFFLVSGTLLGCVREHGIIGHDKDIDVGFDERFPVGLVRDCMLNSPHFTLFDVPFENNVYVQHSNGVAIDIFRHYMCEGKYYHEGIKVKWWNTPFDLQPVEFLGGEYLIPTDYDTYLTENYGNWRVPVSEFETFVDTPNMEVVDVNQLIWYYLTKMNDYYLEGKFAQLRRVISAYTKLVVDPQVSEESFKLTVSA
jgi:tetratricopeptide (TPR) repeat protein